MMGNGIAFEGVEHWWAFWHGRTAKGRIEDGNVCNMIRHCSMGTKANRGVALSSIQLPSSQISH
jgi:hypothetical protein